MGTTRQTIITRPSLYAIFLAWKAEWGVLGDDRFQMVEKRNAKRVFVYQIEAIDQHWYTRREMYAALRFALNAMRRVHDAEGFIVGEVVSADRKRECWEIPCDGSWDMPCNAGCPRVKARKDIGNA